MSDVLASVKCVMCRRFLDNPARYCCTKMDLYCSKCATKCRRCTGGYCSRIQMLQCQSCKKTKTLRACKCRLLCQSCSSNKTCLKCKTDFLQMDSIRPLPETTVRKCQKCQNPQSRCKCLINNPGRTNSYAEYKLKPQFAQKPSSQKKQYKQTELCSHCVRRKEVDKMFCNSFCGHYICLGCFKGRTVLDTEFTCRAIMCHAPIDCETANTFFPICEICGIQYDRVQGKEASKFCDKCSDLMSDNVKPADKSDKPAENMKPDKDAAENANQIPSKPPSEPKPKEVEIDKPQPKPEPVRNNFLTVQEVLGVPLSKSIQKPRDRTPSNRLPPTPQKPPKPSPSKQQPDPEESRLSTSRHTAPGGLAESRMTTNKNPMKSSTYSINSNAAVPNQCCLCGLVLDSKYLLTSNCKLKHKICRYCVGQSKGKPCEACQLQEEMRLKKLYVYSEVPKENRQEYKLQGEPNKAVCNNCGCIGDIARLLRLKEKLYCKMCCIKIVR